MHVCDLLSFSLRSIGRHPLRTFLAALSIAISIGALVTILSGERSWQRALDSLYQDRGVDVVRVQSDFWAGAVTDLPKTADEARRLLAACPAVSAATPVADGASGAKLGAKVADFCRVRGMLPGFERVFGTRLLRGRFLTEEDDRTRAPVCVIDDEFARIVLGDPNILGKEVRIGGYSLKVVGVADKLWRGGLRGPRVMQVGPMYRERGDYIAYCDAGAVVPLSTARRTLGLSVRWLGARADDHHTAIPQLARFLGLEPTEAIKQGTLSSLAEEKGAALAARVRMRLFTGLAALLILLSSGVGLASIMYVAVSERQREIGIHRAHGASGRAIGFTYVMESVWLGVLGAIAGAGLGFAGTWYLGTVGFLRESSGLGETSLGMATSILPQMRVLVDWQGLALAITAGLLVAAAAGYTPASEAAALNPSEAIAGSQATRYRLRRVLTALQLCVGVAAVLLLTSIYEGVALQQLGPLSQYTQEDLVTTTLTLTRSRAEMPVIADPMKALVQDPAQVAAIGRECSRFRAVEGEELIAGQPIKYGRAVAGDETYVFAVTPGYFRAENMRLVEGRLFTPQESAVGARVVVLADPTTAALNLDTATGMLVRIGGLPFRVVGVVDRGFGGGGAFVPFASMPGSWTAAVYPSVSPSLRAYLRTESGYWAAERQLLAALRKRLPAQTMAHLELHGNIADREHLSVMRRASAIRASVIGFSALLIALIGLVNMLLVSVSEQTREIGLRRALGATRPAIAAGVVLEAMLICLPGCVVGVGLGLTAAHFVGGWAKLSTAVPMFWITVSAGTAVLGGLLASLIPAVRAAMLHPVEALRTE